MAIDLPVQVLVQNAALLLAVAVVFDAISLRVDFERTPLQQTIAGLLVGAIGISLMLWGCSSARSPPLPPSP
jgi:hypothetical protein